MITVPELQSYVDERARRHAEAKSRALHLRDQEVAEARLNEAMEIGAYIAKKIAEG